MDTRSTDPQPAAAKSWAALTAQARRAEPPGDLDVRHLVRAALEAGERAPRVLPGDNWSLLEELAALGQSWGLRLALGGCAVLAVAALWNGLDAATGLGIAMDLQSLFVLVP